MSKTSELLKNEHFVDYYKVLGVRSNARAATLRVAYVRLAKTSHPDRGGSLAAMQLINRAYGTLRDPARRAAYDRIYAYHKKPMSREELDELFVDELFYQEVVNGRAHRKQFVRKSFASLFNVLHLHKS